jgi:hypothetical protein
MSDHNQQKELSMYKMIKDKIKIKECQDKFEEIMKDNTEKYNCYINFPKNEGEQRDRRNVFWSSKYGYWSAYKTICDDKGEEKRYWNVFGLKEPKDGVNLIITVEINLPINGTSYGILAEDDTGKIYIAHRGRTRAKASFEDNYKGEWIEVKGCTNKVALIGELPQDNDKQQYSVFQKKVRDFIVEIDRIKNIKEEQVIDFNANQQKQDNNKTAREFMKDIIFEDIKLQKGQTITRQELIDLFRKKHPVYKENGIDSYLRGLVVNDDSRKWYAHNESDDVLYKLEVHPVSYRLYDPEKESPTEKNNAEKTSIIKKGIQLKTNNSSYEKIALEAEELIILINQNCKNIGKEPIFKDGLFELWIDIKKTCSSKNDFEVFSSSLYKLIVENPREENPNFKKTGGHFYEYRYSKYSSEFWKDGTITKCFIDDVKTIRHEFAHTKLVKKTPVKTKAEVLQKYLGSSIEPRLPEKYQEFQFGVLKEFVSFLNKLLEMVENYKPSPPHKPLTS